MEKPYRGLPYHARKGKRPSPKAPCEPEEVWDEAEPLPRAYPDGSAPAECWDYAKAFSQRKSGGDGTCSGI